MFSLHIGYFLVIPVLRKIFIACLFLFSASTQANSKLNLRPGVTEISVEVYDLHMIILYICCVIAVLVYGVILYTIIFHRKSRGAQPSKFTHSTAAEIVWTIIPFLILVAMAIPATNVLLKVENFEKSELTIKAIGLQWRWRYEYQDHDVDFYSALADDSRLASIRNSEFDPTEVSNYLLEVDKPLYVPVGKRVQLLLTSYDVIHSWWVPDLAVKKDAVPGYINRLWFQVEEPGIYRGQCAELCGRGHGYMPIVVHAVSEEEFEQWLLDQKSDSTI